MSEPPTDLTEIRRDIEQARAELAETVDALTAKLDVKAQAKHRAQEVAQRAKADPARTVLVVGGVLVVLLAVRRLRHR